MPPKLRYPRRRILLAALEIARAEGIEAVSARTVAAALGCSTAPVFRAFDSMDSLQDALMHAIVAEFTEATQAELDADPLFSAGLAMVRFTAEQPHLYAALFLRPHAHVSRLGELRRQVAARMAEHPRYAALDAAARFGLVGRASIPVHGLCVEVWFGRLPEPTLPRLRRLLHELADPLVDAAIAHGWTTEIHAPPVPSLPPQPESP